MRKEYKVYLIRELSSNDIKYVGLTRQKLVTRFNAHVIDKKIKRYDYQIELIQDDLSINEAVQLEKMLIKQYNLLVVGWNKSPGSINGCSNYHSEEQKLIWRKTRKGKRVSTDHAEKNKRARLGKKNSPEHNKALLKSLEKPVMCLETGIIYRSARHAAKELGLNYSKISLVCNGLRNTTGGLHFIFIKNNRD